MLKVRALRGVCIGPERHLVVNQEAYLDPGTASFLINIGAVAVVREKRDEPAATTTAITTADAQVVADEEAATARHQTQPKAKEK